MAQGVSLSEANSAVYLVSYSRGHPRRFSYPDLRCCYLEGGVRDRVGKLGRFHGRLDRGVRRRHLPGQERELLLDGLETADGPAELVALLGMSQGQLEDAL